MPASQPSVAAKLPPEKLFRAADLSGFSIRHHGDFRARWDLLGQDRAREAVRFGTEIGERGFNLFAVGASAAQVRELVGAMLREATALKPCPPDWVYVNNFAPPTAPWQSRCRPAARPPSRLPCAASPKTCGAPFPPCSRVRTTRRGAGRSRTNSDRETNAPSRRSARRPLRKGPRSSAPPAASRSRRRTRARSCRRRIQRLARGAAPRRPAGDPGDRARARADAARNPAHREGAAGRGARARSRGHRSRLRPAHRGGAHALRRSAEIAAHLDAMRGDILDNAQLFVAAGADEETPAPPPCVPPCSTATR